MNIVDKLNAQIEQLIHNYELLKYENDALRMEINELKDNNDEIQRSSQDMLLNIDRALTLTAKQDKEKENDFE